jgi:acyl dehydratase
VETVDADDRPVTSTEYGSLYLGVDCEAPHPSPLPGGERVKGAATLSPPGRGQGEGDQVGWAWSADVPIAPTLAHVYTECARIWNPIHTDRAVALAAGLPDIILHGTATLALAITEVLRRQPRGAATRVRSVACRFGAMVRLPSRLVVRGTDGEPSSAGGVVRFEALAEDGGAAVRDGCLTLAP